VFHFVPEPAPNKGILGKAFRKEAKVVIEALERMEPEKVEELEKILAEKG
jgi:glycyl-tRNA synthetase